MAEISRIAALLLVSVLAIGCAAFTSGLNLEEFKSVYGAEFVAVDRIVLVRMSRCKFPGVIAVHHFERGGNVYLASRQSDTGYCPSPLVVDLRYKNLPPNWASRVFWVDNTPFRPRWQNELLHALTLGLAGEYIPAEAITHRIEISLPLEAER